MPVHTTHSSLETQRYSNGHEQARQVARKTRRIQYVCTVPSRCSSTDRGHTAWIGQPAHRTPQPVVLTLALAALGCPSSALSICVGLVRTQSRSIRPQHDSGLMLLLTMSRLGIVAQTAVRRPVKLKAGRLSPVFQYFGTRSYSARAFEAICKAVNDS